MSWFDDLFRSQRAQITETPERAATAQPRPQAGTLLMQQRASDLGQLLQPRPPGPAVQQFLDQRPGRPEAPAFFTPQQRAEQESRRARAAQQQQAAQLARAQADKLYAETSRQQALAFGRGETSVPPQYAHRRQLSQMRTEATERAKADPLPILQAEKIRTDEIERVRAREDAARNRVLAGRELTKEEFDALNQQQQAAVLFNTRAMDADAADRAAGIARGDANSELGRFLQSVDLDASLGLRNVATDDILGLIGTPEATARAFDEYEHAGVGREPSLAARSTQLAEAMQGVMAMSDQISAALLSGLRGDGRESGETPRPLGFGTTEADSAVQYAFDALANADENVSLDDVSQFLADVNERTGAQVSMDDVFNFADLRLRASDFSSTGSPDNAFMLQLDPTKTPRTMSADLLRQKLGL